MLITHIKYFHISDSCIQVLCLGKLDSRCEHSLTWETNISRSPYALIPTTTDKVSCCIGNP